MLQSTFVNIQVPDSAFWVGSMRSNVAPDGGHLEVSGNTGSLYRVTPDGRIDRGIEMPVSNVTNCAFGGPDLRTLYITTASLLAPSGETLAGGLFAMQTDVAGLPTSRFRLAAER